MNVMVGQTEGWMDRHCITAYAVLMHSIAW